MKLFIYALILCGSHSLGDKIAAKHSGSFPSDWDKLLASQRRIYHPGQRSGAPIIRFRPPPLPHRHNPEGQLTAPLPGGRHQAAATPGLREKSIGSLHAHQPHQHKADKKEDDWRKYLLPPYVPARAAQRREDIESLYNQIIRPTEKVILATDDNSPWTPLPGLVNTPRYEAPQFKREIDPIVLANLTQTTGNSNNITTSSQVNVVNSSNTSINSSSSSSGISNVNSQPTFRLVDSTSVPLVVSTFEATQQEQQQEEVSSSHAAFTANHHAPPPRPALPPPPPKTIAVTSSPPPVVQQWPPVYPAAKQPLPPLFKQHDISNGLNSLDTKAASKKVNNPPHHVLASGGQERVKPPRPNHPPPNFRPRRPVGPPPPPSNHPSSAKVAATPQRKNVQQRPRFSVTDSQPAGSSSTVSGYTRPRVHIKVNQKTGDRQDRNLQHQPLKQPQKEPRRQQRRHLQKLNTGASSNTRHRNLRNEQTSQSIVEALLPTNIINSFLPL